MTMHAYEERYERTDRLVLWGTLILEILLAVSMRHGAWYGWVISFFGWLLLASVLLYLKRMQDLTVGMVPVCLFSLGLCCLGSLFHPMAPWLSILLSLIVILIALCFLWFLAYFEKMSHVKFDPVSPSCGDTVLLPGTSVKDGRPSYELHLRCRAAAELYRRKEGLTFLVSGGKVSDPKISEAEVMKQELMELGVPEGGIVKEENATTTEENMKLTASLLKERNVHGKLYLATSDYHLYRAMHDAQEAGLRVSPLAVPMPFGMREVLWCREALVLMHEHL